MQDYQQAFIALSEEVGALSFGQFTLKSGRVSPYFFNAGAFSSGAALSALANCYAKAILAHGIAFDMLFGPAYKGIPLVAAVSVALHQMTQKTIPYAFNRKEAKDHGEGGLFVGAEIKGKILLLDDVITAGTAVTESLQLLQQTQGEIVAIMVALNREEKAPNSDLSAMQQIEQQHGIKTYAVAGLTQIIDYQKTHDSNSMQALLDYQKRYGI